jgi:hypothetical protein
LLGITNSYEAFCLDEAIVEFGTSLEHALDKATEKAKNQAAADAKARLVLMKWLEDGPAQGDKKFKAPKATTDKVELR